MKRSEFSNIVNTVSHEEWEKLNAKLQEASKLDKDAFPQMIADIASSIPATAARTTAEILVRSGLVSLEEDE